MLIRAVDSSTMGGIGRQVILLLPLSQVFLYPKGLLQYFSVLHKSQPYYGASLFQTLPKVFFILHLGRYV